MKVNFNGKNDRSSRDVDMQRGDFESMTKMRKKQLPKIEQSIQEVLEDYSGESITILIQKEDENGLPDHVRMFMAGVSRSECQIAMAKALDKASNEAIKVLVEGANGDVKALLSIAKSIVEATED